MNTYMYILSPMNISERLSELNLKIYEVGYSERLAVDRDIASH
jgi:hypothetical protein